jgi:hypothetical protein
LGGGGGGALSFLSSPPKSLVKNDIELKRTLRKEFIEASDSIARVAVIQKAELAYMDKVFEKNGIDASAIAKDKKTGKDIVDADGNPMSNRDVIYKAFNDQRAKDMLDFMEESAYSIDSNGTKIVNQVIMSQLAYSHPIMPFEEFADYVLTQFGDPTLWKAFTSNIEQVRGEIIMPAFAKIDTFWRAEVLLRLGYPIRNVLTTGTVLSMHDVGLSGMFSMGSTVTGTSRFFNFQFFYRLFYRL